MQYQDRDNAPSDYDLLKSLYDSDRFYSYSEKRQKYILIYLKLSDKCLNYYFVWQNSDFEKQKTYYYHKYELYNNRINSISKNEYLKYVIKKERNKYNDEIRKKLHEQLVNGNSIISKDLKKIRLNEKNIYLYNQKEKFFSFYTIDKQYDEQTLLKYSINKFEKKEIENLIILLKKFFIIKSELKNYYKAFESSVDASFQNNWKKNWYETNIIEIYKNKKNNSSFGKQVFELRQNCIELQKEYAHIYNSKTIKDIIKRIDCIKNNNYKPNNKKFIENRKDFERKKIIEIIYITSMILGIISIVLISISVFLNIFIPIPFGIILFSIFGGTFLILGYYKNKKNIHYNQFDFSIKQSFVRIIQNKAIKKILRISGVVFVALIFIAFILFCFRAHIKRALAPDSIELSSMIDSVFPGNSEYIRIKGDPDTVYSIRVKYKSGYSTAEGLEDKKTDYDNEASWMWKVGTNTTPGTYPIIITNTKTYYSETFYFTVE